jgi:hypothetical protein
MIEISPKDLTAQVRKAVKSVAPDSARKRTWLVCIHDSITIHAGFGQWDSGSKDVIDAVTLAGSPVDLPHLWLQSSTWIQPEFKIPDDVIVVVHGIFAGKPAFPKLHITQKLADTLGIAN